ncbi:MAG: pyruvate carboxylase [Epsilonproteobacteria bacterium]|nr:MAG: pyruvate carboxylase [Campylobacterota bacterium]
MEVNLVLEGTKFMLLGMSTVLLFLILMIVLMNLQAKIIHRFFPEPQETPVGAGAQKQKINNKIAAITAAIMHHKKLNG